MKAQKILGYMSIRSILVILILFLLLGMISVPVVAAGQETLAGNWDRLNPGSPAGHETLKCGGSTNWRCRYDMQPEPILGYIQPPDSIYGIFIGKDVTLTWSCPDWFPPEICLKVNVGKLNHTFLKIDTSQYLPHARCKPVIPKYDPILSDLMRKICWHEEGSVVMAPSDCPEVYTFFFKFKQR